MFPDVAYDLIGFGKNSKSETSAIIKQSYIQAEREVLSQEIKSYMINYGFKVDDESSFQNEDFYIFDVVPHNVLMGIDKRLYFIDTQIKVITQNLA